MRRIIDQNSFLYLYYILIQTVSPISTPMAS